MIVIYPENTFYDRLGMMTYLGTTKKHFHFPFSFPLGNLDLFLFFCQNLSII